ncbi:cytoskeleton protein RodZ [Vibrio tapetis subsp. quintayensis]|uniref:cytoskeleton protein RodZ n=1 Tax=Vibrio tapetis TaxID=52443 RepID=UPI0025B5AE91|nr:cytoskeleton protein RodZ [Vibrio tapetis]MDN3680118.1 cytoskeleton protein RodZ [Vibrio tapetis subsp. quintayensis]
MSTEQTENNNVAPKQQPGTVLKLKRESLGWSQQEIADRLRLRVSVIENIESNDFKADQVATFTRGYLRSYAKVVGLNEEEVLGLLTGSGNAEHKEQTMQSFSRKTNREKHNNRVMMVTWGIMIALAGISSIWWWQNQEQDTLSPAEISAQAPVEDLIESDLQQVAAVDTTEQLELEATLAADVQENTTDTQPSSELSPVASEATVQEAVAPKVTLEASTDATASAIASDDKSELVAQSALSSESESKAVVSDTQTTDTALAHQLTMEFKADCWIQVKDASGKTLSTGVKKAGRSITLDGQAPYNIILGAPEGVTMTYANEPVDLSGYSAGKVARFKLP